MSYNNLPKMFKKKRWKPEEIVEPVFCRFCGAKAMHGKLVHWPSCEQGQAIK